MPESYDVVVVGAGPAGSSLARLLTLWGRRTLLLAAPPRKRPLAESLPPSIDNVFELFGIRDSIEAAGFYPDHGNTSWWGPGEPRVEVYSGGVRGYHVNRAELDGLLFRLAEDVGVKIGKASRAPRIDLHDGVVEFEGGAVQAKFIVDASGRTGLLARQCTRYWDSRYGTLALCGSFHGQWPTDPQHTLVEAFESGWGWSVPLSKDRRVVCFMVDSGAARGGVQESFERALAATCEFGRMFDLADLEEPPWACDASLYYAKAFAGSNWMLVGDAGSFVDPLSSFGVKKALVSAWTAAVVIHTCLRKPEMASVALELFHERERQTYADHVRQAAHHFGEMESVFGTSFWRDRAKVPDEFRLYDPAALRKAFESIRASDRLQFRRRLSTSCEARPSITGREVVMVERPVISGLPSGLEYSQGVHLPTLFQMVEEHDSAPSMFEAYNAQRSPVGLPGFLSSLALLVALDAVEVT